MGEGNDGELFRMYCNSKSKKNVESERLVSTCAKVRSSLELRAGMIVCVEHDWTGIRLL